MPVDAETPPDDASHAPDGHRGRRVWRQMAGETGFVALSLAAIAAARTGLEGSIAVGTVAVLAVTTALAMHVSLAHDRLRGGLYAIGAAASLAMLAAPATLAAAAVVAGLVASGLVARCATRVCVLRAGIWTGGVAAAIRLIDGLPAPRPDAWPLTVEAMASAAGCVLGASAVVAVGPLAEWAFGHTTRLTMNERLDYDHPLLRRLITAAPGTFQHSVHVGMLADAAARATGGDALVARVGGLYHDVGKINAPTYFVENQHGANPHDGLDPLESVTILKAHVSDGVDLVSTHRLGDRMADFVREHHGTGLMQMFRAKAIALGRDDEPPELYRYAGPKPRSRETGIVMIADQLEATARAVQPGDDAARRDVVRQTLARLQEERQLDDSGLSDEDLAAIETAMVRALQSMHHRRMQYPQPPPLVVTPPVRSAFRGIRGVLRRRRAG